MIRRWSYINKLNSNIWKINCEKLSKFEIRYKINIFKASVNFKKFVFKITKFKRKSIARFKHHSIWLIYTNVIKTWTNDFIFNKRYARFQFFFKMFITNFLFFNFSAAKIKNDNFFFNFNFYFAALPKKSYFYFHPTSFSYLKSSPITFGWLRGLPTVHNLVIPTYGEWDDNFFPHSSKELNKFFEDNLFNFFFFFFFKKIVEIRKILNFLFYISILKR